jgi:hypothetical protein
VIKFRYGQGCEVGKNKGNVYKKKHSQGLSPSYKASSFLLWYTSAVFAAQIGQNPFQSSDIVRLDVYYINTIFIYII